MKNDNRAMLLPDLVSEYGDEGVVATWKPLHCEHRGPGRVARTPHLMYSERRGGKPSQVLLRRLPTIRSCCIAHRLHRAAWWYEVDRIIALWEAGVWSGPLDGIRRDKRSILASLRKVVPPPTPAGVRDFTAYRVQKEQEYQARRARVRAEDEAFNAEQRRREEEARRRAEEQQRYWQWEYRFRVETSGQAAVPGCFAVLGLPPDAGLEQVKKRYRELAKKHHPDHRGDEGQFVRVQKAYEEACAILERRTPA